MKKKLLNFALSLVVMFSAVCALAGCFGGNDPQPYIAVEGMVTTYNIGDEIDLSNAVVKYYEDKDSTTYKTYKITTDMVIGFDTDTPGNRTMTVLYEGLEKEIVYFVNVTKAQAVVVMHSMVNKMNTATIGFMEFSRTFGGTTQVGVTIAKDDENYTLEADGERRWRIHKNDKTIRYTIEAGSDQGVISDDESIVDYTIADLLSALPDDPSTFSQSMIKSVKVNNGMYEIEVCGESLEYTLYINVKTGYLVKLIAVNEEYGMVLSSMYYFNDDVPYGIPSIPNNITWDDQTA